MKKESKFTKKDAKIEILRYDDKVQVYDPYTSICVEKDIPVEFSKFLEAMLSELECKINMY